MGVVLLQRVAGPDGVLLSPQLRAIKAGAFLKVTAKPADVLVGASGGEGQVVGYYELEVDLAALAASLATEGGMYAHEQHYTSEGGTTSVSFWLFEAAVDVTMTGSVYIEPSKQVATDAGDYWSARVVRYTPGGSPVNVSALVPLNETGNWDIAPLAEVPLTAAPGHTVPTDVVLAAGDWVAVYLLATGTPAALPHVTARWHAAPTP